MIELFLDNKVAVLRDNVSIKLTRENVYFNKVGSYTYDVELPLQCVENRRIFGSINRKDVETQSREFHAVLRVDNVVLLDGKAIINQVTDTAVKVQLLGGNSEMNFYSKGNEVYIDELDLGDWMNEVRVWRPDGEQEHYHGDCLAMAYAEQSDWLATGNDSDAYGYWRDRWFKNESNGRTTDKGVAFPVINESADYNAESSHLDAGAIVNGYVLRLGYKGKYWPMYRWSWPNEETHANNRFPQVIASFQPMLIMMIRKVLNVAGYPLEDTSEIALLRNSLFRHIFIVSANNRLELNKALPHWTLNEFLTQVEHFLGIVIEADEITKTTHILSRDAWWGDDVTVIEDIVDEYSVDVDKNETSDITNANVGFADINDDEQHISQDILNVAEFDTTTFTSLSDMGQKIRNGQYVLSKRDKSKIFVVDGHHFIVATGSDKKLYLKEVNQYRMLQRNTGKADVDVELKIRPCPITEWDCPYIMTIQDINGNYIDSEQGTVKVKVFTRPDVQHIGTDNVTVDDQNIDIEDLLSGEQVLEDEEEKEDLMYVGVIPATTSSIKIGETEGYYPEPASFPEIKVDSSGSSHVSQLQREFLCLNKFSEWGDIKTLFSESLESESVVDTTVKYCIKFISHKVLKASGAFIINHQRFACEKLEYSITAKGVSPLVTGYFYRLKD